MLCLVPGIIILPYFYGTNGVWISMPISDATAFTLSIIAFIILYNKIKKENRYSKESTIEVSESR